MPSRTRLTVYNHFPDEGELFAACQSLFATQHPLPDFAEALALADPRARTRSVLHALYAAYPEREPVTAKVLRDRTALPALDALLGRTLDANLAALAETLLAGFRLRGKRRKGLRALLALGLDFWTWRLLASQGLSEDASADLMAGVISTSADG